MDIDSDWERGRKELLNKRYNTSQDFAKQCYDKTKSIVQDSSEIIHTIHEINEGNRIFWLGARGFGSSKIENSIAFVEISPVYLERDKPVDVRVVCLWNPMLVYWEIFAETLDRILTEQTTTIPSQGKALFKGSPESFKNYFMVDVMTSKNPPYNSLVVGLGENDGKYYIDWSDGEKDNPLETVTVFVEPFGKESLLTIYALEKTWSRLQWWWVLLYKKMKSEDLVDVVVPWSEDKFEFTESESTEVLAQDTSTTDSSTHLAGYSTELRQIIDAACIGWAGRGFQPRMNMSEYLNDLYNNLGVYLTTHQFKRALRNAGERGLIIKVNGRWRLPPNSP